jgi:IstB-like ATP binding protein
MAFVGFDHNGAAAELIKRRQYFGYREVEMSDAALQRSSTLVTSNRPFEDWGKLLGDSAAVTAMLDRLLHHGHILNAGRGAGGPSCRRNNERRTENQPENHGLNHRRARENATTAT